MPSLIGLLALLHLTWAGGDSVFKQSEGKCVPMPSNECSDPAVKYNTTIWPNPMTLKYDENVIQHFNPLFATACHPHIKFFVCSVYFPMCPPEYPQAVNSCRDVCREVRRGCEKVLGELKLPWPEILECDHFPEKGGPDLCMSPNTNGDFSSSSSSSSSSNSLSSSCPSFLVDTDIDNSVAPCALPCDKDTLFSSWHKSQLRGWVGVGGGVASLLSLLTFLTFIIQPSRFRFPERCVCYLSLCHLLYSLPFLVSSIDSSLQLGCHTSPSGQRHLVVREVDSLPCTLSFLLSFYFSMAAALWFALFTFTWYLSATRKWVPESLEAASAKVHFCAWLLPLVGTVAVLATHSVDASELTGLCGVGNLSSKNLLAYSIIPRVVIGLAAVVFFLRGMGSMCSERRIFKRRGTDTSKLDKLMLKASLFAVVHMLLLLVFVSVDVVHFQFLEEWEEGTVGCKGSGRPCPETAPRPRGSFYVAQVLVSLLMAATPFVWIASTKTLHSWQMKLCCCFSPAPAKYTPQAVLLPQAPPPRAIPHQYVPLSTSSNPRWGHV